MNTIFDGPDEIDEEYQEILSAIEPDMGDPPMVCKRCGALTPPISPNSREYGTLCQSCTDYKKCVHGPDPDVSVPAGSGSLLSGEIATPGGRAQETVSPAQTLSLDKTESFTAWLDAQGDHLALPDSFKEWLDKNGDAI